MLQLHKHRDFFFLHIAINYLFIPHSISVFILDESYMFVV
jgi:hypothetical protein